MTDNLLKITETFHMKSNIEWTNSSYFEVYIYFTVFQMLIASFERNMPNTAITKIKLCTSLPFNYLFILYLLSTFDR